MESMLQGDDWLTAQLGRPSYRLALGDPIKASEAIIPPEHDAFAWARVEIDDIGAVQTLERAGYGVVDCGLTYEVDADALVVDASATPAQQATEHDRGAMVALAGSAFRVSRFHLDPRFDVATAHAIKSAWVTSAFDGARGDGIVVVPDVGFLIWLAAPDGACVIDLVAVAEHARGRGVVGALTHAAWRAAGSPARLRVGTQAANAAASRAYQRLGFMPVAARYVLHYHGARDDVRS